MALRRSSPSLAILATALLLASCAPDAPTTATGARAVPVPEASVVIPSRGSATDLDVGTWNVEWLGDAANGPTNEATQQANVRDVLLGADQDIWGLQEVVSATAFQQIVAGMPGYAGVLANAASVTDGATFYNGFSNQEQKVALIYRTANVSVLGARVILGTSDFDFAGRPPVEFRLRVTLNGSVEDVVVIVLHAKCCTDDASYTRRSNASAALKNYLDTTWPTQKVWVIGDMNDDMDASITPGRTSPYANFVGDAARYLVPTKALSDAGISTTAGFPDAIDHQIVSNEAGATYVVGSATAYRVDSFITGYATNTSDHFPVLARYRVGGGGTTNQPPVAAFTSNCSGLSCTFTDGSSDPDGSVASRSWNFGDGTTSTTTSPTKSYAAAGTYTVTLTVTDNAGATNSTSRAVTVAVATPARVIINEILANEPGSSTAGEAVELVNIGGTDANIGGWTLRDGSSVRHTFPAGTILRAGRAIAIYGGSAGIPAGSTSAVAASTGQLNLANGGDSVILRNGTTTIDQFTYPSSLASTDGVSANRNPDLTAGAAFSLHTAVSTLPRSIGTRASGAAF